LTDGLLREAGHRPDATLQCQITDTKALQAALRRSVANGISCSVSAASRTSLEAPWPKVPRAIARKRNARNAQDNIPCHRYIAQNIRSPCPRPMLSRVRTSTRTRTFHRAQHPTTNQIGSGGARRSQRMCFSLRPDAGWTRCRLSVVRWHWKSSFRAWQTSLLLIGLAPRTATHLSTRSCTINGVGDAALRSR
jgi:hypothetical protein